jgi:hypothetical protein
MTLDTPYRRTPRRKAAPQPPPAAETAPLLTLRRDIYRVTDPKAPPSPPANVCCIVCVRPAFPPLVTCEVVKKGSDLLYSYQAHEKCWKGISDREKRVFDQALRDLLAKGAT